MLCQCWTVQTYAVHCTSFLTTVSFNSHYVGLRPPLSVGEQLHRQEELPLLLPLPPVPDSSHHGCVWLWPALYPLPSPEHRPPARHRHVSFMDLTRVYFCPLRYRSVTVLSCSAFFSFAQVESDFLRIIFSIAWEDFTPFDSTLSFLC